MKEMKEILIESIEAYKKGEINKSTMLSIIDGFFLLLEENSKNISIDNKNEVKQEIKKL